MNCSNEWFFKWNVITNTFMALIINTAATIFAGGDTVSGWVTGCCCAFTINTIAAILIPVGPLSVRFARGVCKTKPGTLSDLLARNLIVNLIFVTIVSFGMALIHVGFAPNLLSVWFSTYAQLLLVGIIGASLIERPIEKFCDRYGKYKA